MHAEIVPVLRLGSRMAPGARNHCVHGSNEVVVEDVLDVKPFEYYTVEHRPQGSPVSLRMTFCFARTAAGGTHLTLSARGYGRRWPRWATRFVANLAVDRQIRPRWALERIDSLIQAAGE